MIWNCKQKGSLIKQPIEKIQVKKRRIYKKKSEKKRRWFLKSKKGQSDD